MPFDPALDDLVFWDMLSWEIVQPMSVAAASAFLAELGFTTVASSVMVLLNLSDKDVAANLVSQALPHKQMWMWPAGHISLPQTEGNQAFHYPERSWRGGFLLCDRS